MKQLSAELKTATDAIVVAHAHRRRVLVDIATKRCPLKVGKIYTWHGQPHNGCPMRCDEIAPSGGYSGHKVDVKMIEWFAYLTLLKADLTPVMSGKRYRRCLINKLNVRKLTELTHA